MTVRELALAALMPASDGTVDPSQYPEETFALYSIPAFDNGRPDTLRGSEIGSSKRRVRPGDVLLSRIVPHIRRAWIVTPQGKCRMIASGEWIVFRPDGIEPRYLMRYLTCDRFHRQFMRTVAGVGGSLLRARPSQVAKIRLSVPSPTEQQRTADILDKADAIRRKRKEAIALTEDLLRSAFLEMFGDPVGNPKRWPTETIDDLCGRKAGLVDGPFGSSLKPEHYVNDGVKVVRNWNIYDDHFDDSAFKFVTPAKFEDLRRSEVKAGDILITTKGTVGDVCIAPDLGGPAVLSASGTVRLRLPPDGTYLPAFVVAQMTTTSFKTYLKSFEAGSAQQYLNLSAIRKMRLLKPPLKVQEHFATLRLRTRTIKAAAAAASEAADVLYASLTERAFSGRLTKTEAAC